MSGAREEDKAKAVFPSDLSFLLVEEYASHRKVLQSTLRSFGCKVNAFKCKESALSLLRERKHRFDMVIADIGVLNEMGTQFVETVRLKMNIPMILMCSGRDDDINAAELKSFACEVVGKPVGINVVERILQHAIEHRRQRFLVAGNSSRNSNDQENGSNQQRNVGQVYKNRLVWTDDIESIFVEAVNSLGGKDVAVPKKILERMNVPYLTRANIASHLQKHRLHSDPNYMGGKRRRRNAAQAMPVKEIDEQAPVLAHPNCRLLSFEAPEFGPNAQNVSAQQLFGQTGGPSRHSPGMNTDSMNVNRMDELAPVVAHLNCRLLPFEAPEFGSNAQNVWAEQPFSQTEGSSSDSWGMNSYSMQLNKIDNCGNHQVAYFPEPEIAQFPAMPQLNTWQQLYGSMNEDAFVPEPLMMQGMTMPEVAGNSHQPILPTQSSFELQVPTDVTSNEEIPTNLTAELESFLRMDLSDLLFINTYPMQDTCMIDGGLSNGLHHNNYQVGQLEMGDGNNGNAPATDSFFMGNAEANTTAMSMDDLQNMSSSMGRGLQE